MEDRVLPDDGRQIRYDAEELSNPSQLNIGKDRDRTFLLCRWSMSLMPKSSRFEQTTEMGRNGLWQQLGNRVRFRREQLRLDARAAAAHIGVALETYEKYETGERLVPANQLAELAELLAVPVFYFFDDLQIGEIKSRADEAGAHAVYAVATESERIAGLIEDFQELDFEGQQHVLQIARLLANDARRSPVQK
jgi:transcriptional regulator with XRE-family HTH domain